MKTLVFFSASFVATILIGIGILLKGPRQDSTLKNGEDMKEVLALSTYKDDASGVSISFPSDADTPIISESDKKQGLVFKAQSATKPEYIMSLRRESGLRLPAQLSRLKVLDLVVDGAVRSLPQEYPDFRIKSEMDNDFKGRSSHQIVFTYTGPAGEGITQKLTLIEKDEDSALYISQQCRSADFSQLEETVFSPVLDSVTLQ